MNPSRDDAGSRHLVRPRWVWSGLALLLGGSAIVALGMVLTSLPVILVGLAALVVGSIVALYGGITHDSHSVRPLGQDLADVRAGNAHAVIAPRPRSQAAKSRSREMDETRERLVATSQDTPAPQLLPIGSVLVLTVCIWLLVAQWSVYPASATGQHNALRDLGIAIVLALTALRLMLAGPRLWASLVIVAGGCALVVFGSVMRHDSTATAVSEVTCGAIALLGAVLTLDRRGGPA